MVQYDPQKGNTIRNLLNNFTRNRRHKTGPNLWPLFRVKLFNFVSPVLNPFQQPDVSQFLNEAFSLIKQESLEKGTDVKTPVIQFKYPKELESLLDLEIQQEGASHEHLLEEMRKCIQYSVKSGHPHFFNQLYSGLDPYSQVATWVTESVNCNVHTFEATPVHIVVEKYLFQKICSLVGYADGDGIFCPGGAASNCLALHLARYKRFPESKENGFYGLPRLRLYIHEDGHYSIRTAAHYLGFGTSNVVPVKTDEKGRMCPKDLQAKVEEDLAQGFVPLCVVATLGSTVLGAFDPINEVSDVCEKNNLWLHADACYGGSVLLSKKHRHLVDGIARCDSVAWNFHKMCGTPVQCSAFVMKENNLMRKANCSKAEYLYQQDKFYDVSYDVGDKSVQCGRKPDGLKLWLQWKAFGDCGMEAMIDRAFDNARYFVEKIKCTDGFRLVLPEFQCITICFWYIPLRLRGQEETEQWWAEMKTVAPKIKERMVKAGTMMIGFQPLTKKGLVNFFRIVIHNPMNNYADMDFVLSEIDRLGKDL